jgi:hypothetical protein
MPFNSAKKVTGKRATAFGCKWRVPVPYPTCFCKGFKIGHEKHMIESLRLWRHALFGYEDMTYLAFNRYINECSRRRMIINIRT